MTCAGAQLSAMKIVVAGGTGTGSTTMVRSVSEIRPLHTEEPISVPAAVPGRTVTTVALDFGRLTLDERTVLHLFGMPGQDRFRFLWDPLMDGTTGAVVLVDTRALDGSRYAIDCLEGRDTPFIVAVNDFGGPFRSEDEIRGELTLGPDVPLVEFDARDHSSSKFVLIALLKHLKELAG
ncbi:ATP/GTP-binding protein [Streptomyces sp. PKU-EA00015]|uniref:GTP-binding protein n=1 Tax=Streptomyces sp. PKU-EA00015 TaxID=2748326 RepID=UPI00210C2597|nr:ATP/GTP-binding protein [Streptomyces sp. PKU-EA00015]